MPTFTAHQARLTQIADKLSLEKQVTLIDGQTKQSFTVSGQKKQFIKLFSQSLIVIGWRMCVI